MAAVTEVDGTVGYSCSWKIVAYAGKMLRNLRMVGAVIDLFSCGGGELIISPRVIPRIQRRCQLRPAILSRNFAQVLYTSLSGVIKSIRIKSAGFAIQIPRQADLAASIQ